jgi:LacI family transcriptional regulator
VVSEWVWPLIRGAGREAERLGYQVLLRTTGAGRVADLRDPQLGSDLLDGLIIVSWRVPLTFARQLAARSYPVVLIDAFDRPSGIGWVSTQDREGARQATLHLTGLGHRRIAFISGGAAPYLARERVAGYQQGLQEAGVRPADVLQGDFSRQSGFRLAQRLLRRKRRRRHLRGNDLMAIGVLGAPGGVWQCRPSSRWSGSTTSAPDTCARPSPVARPMNRWALAVQQMVGQCARLGAPAPA